MTKKALNLIVSAFVLMPATSFGIEFSTYAHVMIVENLQMSESAGLNFGLINNQDGKCTMAADGNLSGSNGQTCSGSRTPGEFIISGTPDQNIIVSASSSANVEGVSFSPVIDGSAVRTLTGGSTTIKIGGELTLASATMGSKSIDYTFTANYQ